MTADNDTAAALPVERPVHAPADCVWTVLADGWMYSTWVVGASRVRDVDLAWPDVGSRILHSVGAWPALLSDETVVMESISGSLLVLRAKAWPMGEARVEIQVRPTSATTCEVTLVEDAVSGPGRVVPVLVRQPLIAHRNREALRRLALLAEGRHREASAVVQQS